MPQRLDYLFHLLDANIRNRVRVYDDVSTEFITKGDVCQSSSRLPIFVIHMTMSSNENSHIANSKYVDNVVILSEDPSRLLDFPHHLSKKYLGQVLQL